MFSRKTLLTAIGICILFAPVAFGAPGAIFTTDVACTGTNVNIFSSKEDVYLDGGPVKDGAAGLPDGSYYVRVTAPDGTPLGTSVGSSNDTPAVVEDGEFLECYQLTQILIRNSNGLPGFDDTTNDGGVYKVWISTSSDFAGGTNKTDNFKVEQDGGGEDPEAATLNVLKFYDANANGINDDGQLIEGWQVNIANGISIDRFTPVSIILEPGTYTVTEYNSIVGNWLGTTDNPVVVTLENGDEELVEFGNLCLGAGGGLTLGYWSNKNGGRTINNNTCLPGVLDLKLRKANGDLLGNVSLADFQKFLTSASATNMANMLSAQLAAMWLNVHCSGAVDENALILAPGTDSANDLGFATVGAVIDEANALLQGTGLILSGDALRPRAEALKNALDDANNNTNFVQPTPCDFEFEEVTE